MLGQTLRDPLGIESATVRVNARATSKAGLFAQACGLALSAYEIHMGLTERHGGNHPFTVTRRNGIATEHADGAIDKRGNVLGTYLHGLFANDGLRRALLVELAARRGLAPDPRWGRSSGGDRYDRLADVVAGALDLTLLARLLRVDPRRL